MQARAKVCAKERRGRAYVPGRPKKKTSSPALAYRHHTVQVHSARDCSCAVREGEVWGKKERREESRAGLSRRARRREAKSPPALALARWPRGEGEMEERRAARGA